MVASDETELAVAACHMCGKNSELKDCVGCRLKVCKGDRGAGGDDYRDAGDKEGFACQRCIEQGKAVQNGKWADLHRITVAVGEIGTGLRQIRTTLGGIEVNLPPEVMKQVDLRLGAIQREIVTPTVKQVTDKADALVETALAETGKQLEKQIKTVADAIDGRVDKLTVAVERLNPSKLLWQAGLVFGLVNVATVIAAVWIAKHM